MNSSINSEKIFGGRKLSGPPLPSHHHRVSLIVQRYTLEPEWLFYEPFGNKISRSCVVYFYVHHTRTGASGIPVLVGLRFFSVSQRVLRGFRLNFLNSERFFFSFFYSSGIGISKTLRKLHGTFIKTDWDGSFYLQLLLLLLLLSATRFTLYALLKIVDVLPTDEVHECNSIRKPKK